jgi:hypothetical protein
MQNRFMVWLMLHNKFSTKTYYMYSGTSAMQNRLSAMADAA